MSNIYLLILIALVLGAVLPTQVAINTRLAVAVESPLISAFISFLVGTIALLSYILIAGIPLSHAAGVRHAPPIAWTGGLIGAFYVAMSIVLLPKLGVALTISLIIAGQMIMSLVIDHFGLFGVPIREMSFLRVAGVLLIVLGVVMIRKF
ncbi:MAG TPA: DMT family transporter [Pyrinomonadaceae bacterium]|nr:DMT family transporter [Pyrinomonadaceae bacterium]